MSSFLKLANPFEVIRVLRERNQVILMVVMLSPFIDGALSGRFSIFLGALGFWAFFKIAGLVLADDTQI